MRTLAEKYFAPIPAQVLPKAYNPKELTAIGEREVKLELPAKVANLYLGFNVPSLTMPKHRKRLIAYA